MVLVPFDIRILPGNLSDSFVPKGHAHGDSVGFGSGSKVFLGAALRQFKSIFQDPVHTLPGEDGLLQYDLPVGVLKYFPAYTRVLPLRVLTHHVEVDISGLASGKRTGNTLHQPYRAQVYVLIELPAELQYGTPQGDVVGDHVRPADSAEKDSVIGLELSVPVLWQHLTVLLVVFDARPVEMTELDVDPVFTGGGFQHPQSFRDHFLANPISRDDCNPVAFHFSLT